MARIEAAGIPALRLDPLRALRDVPELDDVRMMKYLRAALLDPGAVNPSVETLLHAFLPHKFIDHTHANAVLAVVNQPDGERICRRIYGDRLVVVHDTGDLLHIPAAEHALVSSAVGGAADAFARMAAVTDDQITDFFEQFAQRLADDEAFAPVGAANEADVASALERGRHTGRLVLSAGMRADMVAGLRAWRDIPTRRQQQVGEVHHQGWTVQQWRDPLGVVGFVFEGRPNVFADATGVLRTGNTVVFRIGSDALGTARAIIDHAVRQIGRAHV